MSLNSSPFAAARRGPRYEFVDYATQVYLVLVGLLILFFHDGRVAAWPWLLGAHAAAAVAIHALICTGAANPRRRALDALRHLYPILLYGFLYRETAALNRMFVSHYLDGTFIRMDQWLFGFQPSLRFMDALPYLPVSEVFHFAYFSYYVMIVGIGVALYARARSQVLHYISMISFVFYACYLAFIFLPVVGPLVFQLDVPGFPEQRSLPGFPLAHPPAVTAGPFFNLMQLIYRYGEGHGGAFPSSHVAIAISTAYFSWRYLPRIRVAHLVLVVLLCLATVYCRYHYAVDVLAGAATAAVLLPVGEVLYRKLG